MYSILIVDDDIHYIEQLKSDQCFERVDISKIYVAYDIHQAREIFLSAHIDILLCDIEMPQGSGIELLEWIKEEGINTISILLTCHADFRYAKKALQIGCLDYLLKPVEISELEKVLTKAENLINKNSEVKQISQYQQLWTKNHSLAIESFWLNIISDATLSNSEAVKELAENLNVPITSEVKFLPVFAGIQRYHKELSIRDVKIIEYTVKRSASELIISKNRNGNVIKLSSTDILIILPFGNLEDSYLQSLRKDCENLIATSNQLHCDLSCYIGKAVYAHEMSDAIAELTLLKNNNVILNKVLLINETNNVIKTNIPDMNLWALMLKNGKVEETISGVSRFLNELIRTEEVNSVTLRQFHQEFLQMIYFALNKHNIQMKHLFSDAVAMELEAKATHSVLDMEVWVKHVLEKIMNQFGVLEATNGMIVKIQQYIAVHLDEDDMSRESIANYVFVNPDHLTRIFKKKTGITISDYIFQERMKRAKELLIITELSVSAIASAVGYTHFSHFSKMFKKNTGYNPMDYRNINKIIEN